MAVYGEGVLGEEVYAESAPTVITVAIALAFATAAGLAPVVSGDVYTVPVQMGTATAAGLSPAAAQQATVVPTPATATAVGLTPRISAGQLTLPLATGVAVGLPPLVTIVIPGGSDTSNGLDGRSRDAVATGTVTRPVAPVPPGRTLGERYDKTIAYPTPVMNRGRPT